MTTSDEIIRQLVTADDDKAARDLVECDLCVMVRIVKEKGERDMKTGVILLEDGKPVDELMQLPRWAAALIVDQMTEQTLALHKELVVEFKPEPAGDAAGTVVDRPAGNAEGTVADRPSGNAEGTVADRPAGDAAGTVVN